MLGLRRVVCCKTRRKDPNKALYRFPSTKKHACCSALQFDSPTNKASRTSRAMRRLSKQDMASLMKQQSTPSTFLFKDSANAVYSFISNRGCIVL